MNQPPPLPPPQTDYVPCPKCQSGDIKKLTFTWWGGLVGPALFTHVKCQRCGATFNGKNGKDNTTAIALYLGVVGLLVIGICIGIVIAMRS